MARPRPERRLSFSKILSIRIRALRQNPGIIRCDAQSPPGDGHFRRQPVQAAAPAGSREPFSPSSAQCLHVGCRTVCGWVRVTGRRWYGSPGFGRVCSNCRASFSPTRSGGCIGWGFGPIGAGNLTPSLSRTKWVGAASHGNASTICCANHSAVGCRVTANQSNCRRPWPTTRKANRHSNVRVGTTHRSIAAAHLFPPH
jgi:hypothetical protein